MKYWNHSSGDLLHRLLYTDIKTYLVELLMKQDQMSMAASIESRVPFLDHALVEFTASIPAKYATRGMAGKCILKAAVEDLLPIQLYIDKRWDFPRLGHIGLQGPSLDALRSLLLEARTLERGLFRAEAVNRLFAEHTAGLSRSRQSHLAIAESGVVVQGVRGGRADFRLGPARQRGGIPMSIFPAAGASRLSELILNHPVSTEDAGNPSPVGTGARRR